MIVANECAENLFGDQLHSWQPNAGNTQMRELSIIGKIISHFSVNFIRAQGLTFSILVVTIN